MKLASIINKALSVPVYGIGEAGDPAQFNRDLEVWQRPEHPLYCEVIDFNALHMMSTSITPCSSLLLWFCGCCSSTCSLLLFAIVVMRLAIGADYYCAVDPAGFSLLMFLLQSFLLFLVLFFVAVVIVSAAAPALVMLLGMEWRWGIREGTTESETVSGAGGSLASCPYVPGVPAGWALTP